MTDDTPTPIAQAYLEALRRLIDAKEGRGDITPEEARAAKCGPTHHLACDCREWQIEQEHRRLEARLAAEVAENNRIRDRHNEARCQLDRCRAELLRVAEALKAEQALADRLKKELDAKSAECERLRDALDDSLATTLTEAEQAELRKARADADAAEALTHMSDRVVLFPGLPEKPCNNCKHRGRIPGSAGITDGCYRRGVVLGMRYPACFEAETKEVGK